MDAPSPPAWMAMGLPQDFAPEAKDIAEEPHDIAEDSPPTAVSPLFGQDPDLPRAVTVEVQGEEEMVWIDPIRGPHIYQVNGKTSFMKMKGVPLEHVEFYARPRRDYNSTGALKGWSGMTVTEQEVLLLQAAKKNHALRSWKGDEFIEQQALLVRAQVEAALTEEAGAADVGGPADHGGPVRIDDNLKIEIKNEAKVKNKADALLLYAPQYKALGYPIIGVKLRVLCFHNAGGSGMVFTQRGTPFMEWAQESKLVEIVALDYPGRGKHMRAKRHTSTETLAPDLLATLFDKFAHGSVPYIVWAHSVGTWVAFEFLIAARKIGMDMPIAAFFNAFPAPHMPPAERPWPKSVKLNEEKLKAELLNWDYDRFTGAGKVALEEPYWKDTLEPQVRADFRLFDEYKFKHSGAPMFDFPIHAWHFEKDTYNTPAQIQRWVDWTTSEFEYTEMPGMGHLTCLYDADQKTEYFQKVTDAIRGRVNL